MLIKTYCEVCGAKLKEDAYGIYCFNEVFPSHTPPEKFRRFTQEDSNDG